MNELKQQPNVVDERHAEAKATSESIADKLNDTSFGVTQDLRDRGQQDHRMTFAERNEQLLDRGMLEDFRPKLQTVSATVIGATVERDRNFQQEQEELLHGKKSKKKGDRGHGRQGEEASLRAIIAQAQRLNQPDNEPESTETSGSTMDSDTRYALIHGKADELKVDGGADTRLTQQSSSPEREQAEEQEQQQEQERKVVFEDESSVEQQQVVPQVLELEKALRTDPNTDIRVQALDQEIAREERNYARLRQTIGGIQRQINIEQRTCDELNWIERLSGQDKVLQKSIAAEFERATKYQEQEAQLKERLEELKHYQAVLIAQEQAGQAAEGAGDLMNAQRHYNAAHAAYLSGLTLDGVSMKDVLSSPDYMAALLDLQEKLNRIDQGLEMAHQVTGCVRDGAVIIGATLATAGVATTVGGGLGILAGTAAGTGYGAVAGGTSNAVEEVGEVVVNGKKVKQAFQDWQDQTTQHIKQSFNVAVATSTSLGGASMLKLGAKGVAWAGGFAGGGMGGIARAMESVQQRQQLIAEFAVTHVEEDWSDEQYQQELNCFLDDNGLSYTDVAVHVGVDTLAGALSGAAGGKLGALKATRGVLAKLGATAAEGAIDVGVGVVSAHAHAAQDGRQVTKGEMVSETFNAIAGTIVGEAAGQAQSGMRAGRLVTPSALAVTAVKMQPGQINTSASSLARVPKQVRTTVEVLGNGVSQGINQRLHTNANIEKVQAFGQQMARRTTDNAMHLIEQGQSHSLIDAHRQAGRSNIGQADQLVKDLGVSDSTECVIHEVLGGKPKHGRMHMDKQLLVDRLTKQGLPEGKAKKEVDYLEKVLRKSGPEAEKIMNYWEEKITEDTFRWVDEEFSKSYQKESDLYLKEAVDKDSKLGKEIKEEARRRGIQEEEVRRRCTEEGLQGNREVLYDSWRRAVSDGVRRALGTYGKRYFVRPGDIDPFDNQTIQMELADHTSPANASDLSRHNKADHRGAVDQAIGEEMNRLKRWQVESVLASGDLEVSTYQRSVTGVVSLVDRRLRSRPKFSQTDRQSFMQPKESSNKALFPPEHPTESAVMKAFENGIKSNNIA